MEYSTKRPIWQWILIYLVIGGLLYAIAYYAFLKPASYVAPDTLSPTPTQMTTPTPATSSAKINEHIILAKSTGFDPQTLTIKAGDIVIWTNKGSQNIYIASSPHPQHTDYPALNLGVVKPGESVSLAFPTSGTYKYHDHLNASHYGSITVQ